MKDDEALMWLFLVLVAAAIVIYGYVLWAIVWFIVSAIIGYIAYQRYLKEGEREFDETARDLGVDLPVDDILQSMGIHVSDNGGFETAAEWMVGTPLGVCDEWDS